MLNVFHLCYAPGVHPSTHLLVIDLNDRVATHYCKRNSILGGGGEGRRGRGGGEGRRGGGGEEGEEGGRTE